MTRCMGVTGWLFGHDYRARYDKGPAGDVQMHWFRVQDLVDAAEASKQITYRGDVCRRCGDVVNTGEKNEQ